MNPKDIARMITEDPDVMADDRWQLIVDPGFRYTDPEPGQRGSDEVAALIDDPVRILIDRGLGHDLAVALLAGAMKRKTPLRLIDTDKYWGGYLIPPNVEFSHPTVQLTKVSLDMVREYLDFHDIDVSPVYYSISDPHAKGGCRIEIDHNGRKAHVISRASEWPKMELVIDTDQSLMAQLAMDPWRAHAMAKKDTFIFGEDDFDIILEFLNESE